MPIPISFNQPKVASRFMYKILTLNNISVKGLQRLPRENYEVVSEASHPDAVLLRSFKMHDMDIPESVAAIGRAGAGVNNIPVEKMTNLGVPVFNALTDEYHPTQALADLLTMKQVDSKTFEIKDFS